MLRSTPNNRKQIIRKIRRRNLARGTGWHEKPETINAKHTTYCTHSAINQYSDTC